MKGKRNQIQKEDRTKMMNTQDNIQIHNNMTTTQTTLKKIA